MSAAAGPMLDTPWLTIYDPLGRPPAFVGLELCVLACGALTLLDALHARRGGDRTALFTWAAALLYGLLMELVSYHFIDNFAHGQFTVMLYHQKLPLYVSALYPAFIYTAIRIVGRLRLGRVAEPFAVGIFIVALDIPFDILGPLRGFWSWSTRDPNIAYRWFGVPVTSYYWHLCFGGSLALLVRSLQPWIGRRRGWLLALPVAMGTIVLGMACFVPFHVLKARGVADGRIVAGLFVLSLLFLLLSRKRPPGGRDRLWRVPALLYAFHVPLLLLGGPGITDLGGRLAMVAGAGVLLLAVHALARGSGATWPGPATG